MSDNLPPKRTWFYDALTPDLGILHRVDDFLYSGRSAYQSIEIIRTRSFGTCLVLDGKIQSSEADEFIYHEALVQPAMIAHPEPRRVLIAGGGEGAPLREILRHDSVEQATMVDLDEQVVTICRQYLPSFSDGAFDDPRTEFIVADARKFVEETSLTFDVIVIDLPDPLEVGPAQLLYTREFYAAVKSNLTPGGIVSVQSESSRWYDLEAFVAIVRTIREVFSFVAPYQVHIPSFSSLWGFVTASDSLRPDTLTGEQVDRRITQKIRREPGSYDGLSHTSMFSLPKHIRTAVENTDTVITDDAPLSVF